MENAKIANLYDLSETIAADLLKVQPIRGSFYLR